MIGTDLLDLPCGFSDCLRVFSFECVDLVLPQPALQVSMKRERLQWTAERNAPTFSAERDCGRAKNEVAFRVDADLDVNPLEIRRGLNRVPMANGRADRVLPAPLLNAIMSHATGNNLTRARQLVISPDGHEGTGRNAVRCLQNDRAGTALTQKSLDCRRHGMEIVLWITAGATFRFGLLKMHCVNSASS